LEQILLHKRIPLLGELELEKILPLEEVDQIPARKEFLSLVSWNRAISIGAFRPSGSWNISNSLKEFLSWVSGTDLSPRRNSLLRNWILLHIFSSLG
jgi:hypothetical protein